jgi:hypothetical protein
MNYFSSFPLFEGCGFDLLRDIYLNAFTLNLYKNDIVFNENDDSDAVYIIKSGEICVIKKNKYIYIYYFFLKNKKTYTMFSHNNNNLGNNNNSYK